MNQLLWWRAATLDSGNNAGMARGLLWRLVNVDWLSSDEMIPAR
jgi:hypothetical protein